MTMRVLLRDLSPGADYAIQFRSKNGENVSEWSQIQRFTTTNDTIRPDDVKNLSWYASGSSFIGQWDRVTTDEFGNAMNDFRHYRCNVSDGVSNYDFFVVDPRFEFTREMNEATFGSFKTVLTLKVWAVDLTYNESPHVAQVSVNPLNPPTPWAATISNYLGLLLVSWNGFDSTFMPMPTNFSYCEVHASTVSGFTPTATTFVGRLFADGSGSNMTVSGLTYGTTYYVRLIAVNLLNRRSAPSAQASGMPGRISGLDIQNGQISKDQINFTARDIGGANAFYSTSQPTVGMVDGDIWYDTDNGYTTYRYNGTTWVLAPEIGVISGTKIIAGTVTADAVGTNLLIANRANIADAIIDAAHIQSVNAGAIRTGSLQADGRIIAGPELENHAEITSTGFYVKGPQPGIAEGLPPIIVDRIRMGTGVSDFFAIPDPLDPDSTLAQIDENGIASFQDLYVQSDPTIQGKKLTQILEESGGGRVVGEAYIGPFNGLHSADAKGIRDEYGIGQFHFTVKKNHTYEISAKLQHWLVSNGGEVWMRMRVQNDLRTPAEIAANVAPTPVTNSSQEIYHVPSSGYANNSWQAPTITARYLSGNYEGVVSIGYSMRLTWPVGTDSVIKITEGSYLSMWAKDLGVTQAPSGLQHNQGGTLYAYTTPPPPPPPAKQQYYGEWRYNWVQSYKGNNTHMSNTNGRAYQGTDPSGYNGNQIGYFGFAGLDFTTLGPQIDRIVLYLYFAHWYYNAGGTARIGYHNQWSDPGTSGRPGNLLGTFDSGGWPKPGGRELDITGWAGAMVNGSFRGIALGPGNNGYQNYGYATDCVLKVWYTK